MSLKCIAQEQNTMFPTKAELGALDPETCARTVGVTAPPQKRQGVGRPRPSFNPFTLHKVSHAETQVTQCAIQNKATRTNQLDFPKSHRVTSVSARLILHDMTAPCDGFSYKWNDT